MRLEKLVIGDLVLDLPIIQGGMGVGVSKASLAGAVSAEGGLGVIASVGLGEDDTGQSYEHRSREALREEIRKVKQRGLPVGVNVMVALGNYQSLVEVCVEEGVDVIISGAGLPLRLPGYAKNSKTKLVPIVSSGRAATLICNTWLRKFDYLPDAIVVEGPLAGGHLGFRFEELDDGSAIPVETLVADVIEVARGVEKEHGKKIPVIAAGGVFTGQDIARFLQIGAGGVQMGTRFVATHECDAAEEYKQTFVNARKEDIVVIKSPVGMPARVIMNEFIRKCQNGLAGGFKCTYKCLISCEARAAQYCIGDALLNASRGDFDHGFAMCGQNVYRVDKIVSVKELMAELVEGLKAAGYTR